MKKNQLISLALLFAFGLVWIFLLQSSVFLYLFSGILQIPGVSLSDYLQFACSPAFKIFWFGCITALLIWISITFSRKPRSAIQVREMQPQWWLAAGLLTLYGWFSLFWCTVLQFQFRGNSPVPGGGPNYYPVSPGGWVLLLLFVLLDVVLLFWLPTLLATPRNYRLVVPGSVKLLGSR